MVLGSRVLGICCDGVGENGGGRLRARREL